MIEATDVRTARSSRRLLWWLAVPAAAGAVVLVGLLVHWIPSGSSSSGPSLLQPPAAVAPARSERPAFMIGRRAHDVLVGLAVRRGGPIDARVVAADMKPLPADAVKVTVGGARAPTAACGENCVRVTARHALEAPVTVTATIRRPGKPPATASFTLPAHMPPSADAYLRAVNRRMQAVRSFQVDETLSSGLARVDARFLFRAPDRMSYVLNNGSKAVVIGTRRWDVDKGGPWQESSSPGVSVPSYMWDGAGSARFLGRSTVAGKPVRVVAAFRPDPAFPAWFRLYVRGDRRVVRGDMVAPAHFMRDDLSRFDAPIEIKPPGASARPTVWDQMRPIGRGPLYRPRPLSTAVARALPVGTLRCTADTGARVGAHLELFANERVVIVPAGVGVAPPHRRDGIYVRGGRCTYPALTTEPTGVIQLRRGTGVTLGELFRLWGQPLSARRLAGFSARHGERVRAYVDGRAWRGELGAIPLRRHTEVVLEVNGYVPPHAQYLFPPGL